MSVILSQMQLYITSKCAQLQLKLFHTEKNPNDCQLYASKFDLSLFFILE